MDGEGFGLVREAGGAGSEFFFSVGFCGGRVLSFCLVWVFSIGFRDLIKIYG
jgi:hypothetical protein